MTVYKLVCRDTIEERVLGMAAKKDALARSLLSETRGATPKRISTDEVLALLS